MRNFTRMLSVAALALMASTVPGRSNEAAAAGSAVQVAEITTTAPEFTGLGNWFNSQPLTLASLRGKVVLVNFWTYGCVNCVNTLPHVTQLYAKYKDKGFVVVGIHTPEFPFEHSANNVQAALKRHGITYPVAQDNKSATWMLTAISIGRRSTSSINPARSSTATPARAPTMKSTAPSASC